MKKPTLKQLLLAQKARRDEISQLRREVRKLQKQIDNKISK